MTRWPRRSRDGIRGDPFHSRAEPGIPEHPYRDTAILHGGLAAVIVVIAVATGANLGTALVVAPLYFVAATVWSWWRFSQRIRRAEAAARETTRTDSEGAQ